MSGVTGVGGTFLKARDPEALYAWYEKHFNMKRMGGFFFFPAETVTSYTLLAFFPESSKKMGTSGQSAMLNLVVDDLDALLVSLREGGVEIDPHQEDSEYGKFAWCNDLEGNRVELFQPAAES